jgi:tRNA U34 5-methylaminomethyl-2-thiouridine-forming methyltransferase MnmC
MEIKYAEIEFQESSDGSHTLFSKEFGYTYHSIHGAVQESQHIFIESALRFKAVVMSKINVLDIGFGTGLNAYLTYLEALKRNLTIQYTTYEAYPITVQTAESLNYVACLKSEEHQAMFMKLHESAWNINSKLHKQFSLEKKMSKAEFLEEKNKYDIIYFDAFAPDVQPELWDADAMQKMYDALKKDGILVTYCAKGQVRRNMKAAGFTIEKIAGPPGKREMTRATK